MNTKPAKLLPLFASVMAVTPFAIDMYLPAMPTIAEALNSDINLLQNSLSIFLIAYAIGMVVFGPLADRIERKIMLVFGLSGYAIFSFLLATSNNPDQFIQFRFFQAFFGGAATVVIPGTISLLFKEQTAKGLSYVSLIMMLAPMVAPAIGGFLLHWYGWPAIFITLGGYAVFVLIACLIFFPKLEKPLNPRKGLKDIYLSGYAQIFSHRRTHAFLLISMLASFAFFTYITGISFVYISVYGLSETTFSLVFALNVVVLILANLTNARFSTKVGVRKMIVITWSVAMTSATFLYFSIVMALDFVFVVIGLLPIMGCMMITIINADTLILRQFSQSTGTAAAVIGTLRFSSGALAGPLLAYFYNGTALPFAIMMMVSVFSVGLVHFTLSPARREKRPTSKI